MLNQLNPKQSEILTLLKSVPKPLTADELVKRIGITKTAVKLHLERLMDLKLVTFEDQKGQVGRPTRYYKLSSEGEEVFPRQYSWLANLMLKKLLKDNSKVEISHFMREMADSIYDQFSASLESEHLDTRLEKLNSLLNEIGYNTTLKSNSKEYQIEAFNCVYHKIAKDNPELCQFDLQLIKKSSKLNPVLKSCIAKGGSSCLFCLAKK